MWTIAILRTFPGKYALCLLLLTAASHVGAQSASVQFRHITIDDGLSQNAVRAITQDSRGFMWIGTKDGLNRFDGYEFTVFQHDPFDTTTISDNHILVIYEDSQANLWVATRVGLDMYDPQTERFHHIDLSSRTCPASSGFRVQAMTEDAAGRLWIGTRAGGIIVLTDPSGKRQFRNILCNTRPTLRSVQDILWDEAHIWAATEAGLLKIDPEDMAYTEYPVYAKLPEAVSTDVDSSITSLYADSTDILWLGHLSGVTKFDKRSGTSRHFRHHYAVFRYGWGNIASIGPDRATGRLWLGAVDELMRFDPRTGQFEYFRYDPFNPSGIGGLGVVTIFEDAGGLMWFGSNGHGMSVHDPVKSDFGKFIRTPDPASRIQDFSVRTIFEDSRDNVWISSHVLYRWNRQNATLISYERSSNEVAAFGNTGIYSIIEDREGWLWMASVEGLYRHHFADSTVIHYTHDPENAATLPEKSVNLVFEDSHGQIWIMTDRYICWFGDDGASFDYLPYCEECQTGEATFARIHERQDGLFWISAHTGLYLFDPFEHQILRHFSSSPDNPQGLSNSVIRCMTPDPVYPDSFLWIGTSGGGLNRFEVATETTTHYTEADGLPDNVVYAVLPDDNGALWLSTNRGICLFHPQTGVVRNFDVRDNLQSNEFNAGAYFRSPDGELFFGGIKGLNYFYPDQIRINTHIPKIAITGLWLGNNEIHADDTTGILKQNIVATKELTLSYREDIITIGYTALDFSAPDRNQYRYRLEGWDKAWINAGHTRKATYSNLPAGAYTLHITGSNNDGVWNTDGATLRLIITPPWWATTWAYIIYGIAALALLIWIRRYENNRIRLKEQLALQHVRAREMQELDAMKARFFANISHEFRTPLTLILGPAEQLRQHVSKQTGSGLLQTIETNAGRLLKLINQILDLSKLEAGKLKVQAVPGDIVAHLTALAASYDSLADMQGKQLVLRSASRGPIVAYDRDKLEQIMLNLLSNAFKNTSEGDTIEISVEVESLSDQELQLHLGVSDSGFGISEEALPHIFDRFYQVSESDAAAGTGLGLALVKELVNVQGGTIHVESLEGLGTKFLMTLPLQAVQAETEGQSLFPAGVTDESSVTAPSYDSEVAADSKHPVVLLIEDNEDIRKLIRLDLDDKYQVLEAGNGSEGLATAYEEIPDLIITDLMMPVLDGVALCAELKQDMRTSHIPIIMLTARGSREDKLKGLETGADDYLIKPFDHAELKVRINNLITSRQALKERFSHRDMSGREAIFMEADRALYDQVCAIIEDHLGDEQFGVEMLSAALHLSERQVRRKFKAVFNETPNQFIRNFRLRRAQEMLLHEGMRVSEVCYAVGFSNLSYFTKCFKELYGKTPSTIASQSG